MMILNPKDIHSENKRLTRFEGVWQMDLVELLSEVTGWI